MRRLRNSASRVGAHLSSAPRRRTGSSPRSAGRACRGSAAASTCRRPTRRRPRPCRRARATRSTSRKHRQRLAVVDVRLAELADLDPGAATSAARRCDAVGAGGVQIAARRSQESLRGAGPYLRRLRVSTRVRTYAARIGLPRDRESWSDQSATRRRRASTCRAARRSSAACRRSPDRASRCDRVVDEQRRRR